ncbi:SHOCT domain-containing protein [Geodermatophilus ruber]|uniref:Putative membrane protein n=1 Tax=Geodermatophilus ruber TaxID=504800 RepID=A0A1I4HMC9_9ACTN|nr:SHOCT domain-containing protein [Geodermatophilus ruber]SFL43332.1 putative membrane protein [Geodermatophilus ruber]
MHDEWEMDWDSDWGWGWAFWLLLLVGAVLLLVVVTARFLSGPARGRQRTGTPMGSVGPPAPAAAAPAHGRAREILDERYARGEISTEEYRERRRGLMEPG